MMRTSTRRRLVPPTRRTALVVERAQQAGCSVERQLADLVEEQRAAVRRARTRPACSRVRAGEGAALVTEQLALDQVGGTAPQSNDDERPVARAGSASWIACATTSLPVPVSPVGQRHVSRGELADQRIHLPHRRRDGGEVIAGWHRGGRQRRKLWRRTTCWTQARFWKSQTQGSTRRAARLHQPALIPVGSRVNVTIRVRFRFARPPLSQAAFASLRPLPAAFASATNGASIDDSIARALSPTDRDARPEPTLSSRSCRLDAQMPSEIHDVSSGNRKLTFEFRTARRLLRGRTRSSRRRRRSSGWSPPGRTRNRYRPGDR